MVAPPASLTATSIESFVCAWIGTGSNPPSESVVTSDAAPPTRRMVAVAPAGTVPGVKETYTTSSAALAC